MLIRDMRPPHLISFQRVLVRTLSPSLPILHKMGVNLAVLISFRTVLEKKLQMMARWPVSKFRRWIVSWGNYLSRGRLMGRWGTRGTLVRLWGTWISRGAPSGSWYSCWGIDLFKWALRTVYWDSVSNWWGIARSLLARCRPLCPSSALPRTSPRWCWTACSSTTPAGSSWRSNPSAACRWSWTSPACCILWGDPERSNRNSRILCREPSNLSRVPWGVEITRDRWRLVQPVWRCWRSLFGWRDLS